MGVIYILTNPSFPAFVKIGYTDDMESRLVQLNRTECTPFAFRVYATYDVETRLSDKRVHDIIDKLNPGLRAIDYVDGVERKREFYEMSAEDAFSILEAIAEINAREENLHLWELSDKELEEEQEALEVDERRKERLAPFSFDKCNIGIGEEIVFTCRGNEHSGTACIVTSNKKVEYNGREWSLSDLAGTLTGRVSVAGPRYFKYNGRWLNDIRAEIEGWESRRTEAVAEDSWVIPCDPGYYDVERAFAELGEIEWRQSTYISPGDNVYIYISSPVKAIRFKCKAIETDLYGPSDIDDEKYYLGEPNKDGKRHMRLKLIEEFDVGRYPLNVLRRLGLANVQGPRRMPTELMELIESGGE